MTRLADLSRLMGAAALLATLGACGGGGDDTVAPAPAAAPAGPATQGFWSGRVDAQTTASAIFLPEGPAMIVLQSGSTPTLVMGTVANNGNSFSLTGRSYNLGGGSAPYSSSGTVVPKTTLNVGAAGTTPAYPLAYNAGFERAAQLPEIAGRWIARFSGGTLTLTLDIAATGAISGSTASGCSYTGSVAPHGNVAVYDLSLREACPGAAPVQFNGYATLNDARTVLSVGATTADGATATVFQATH